MADIEPILDRVELDQEIYRWVSDGTKTQVAVQNDAMRMRFLDSHMRRISIDLNSLPAGAIAGLEVWVKKLEE